jgi:hypothetical protein
MKIIKTLLLLAIVITVSSCTKDNEEPTIINSISASVSGTATSFNTNVTASSTAANETKLTKIQGSASDGSTLLVTIGGELVEGKTYTAATVGAAEKPIISLTSGNDIYLNNDAGATLVSITVTSISPNFIEGAFKGDLATVGASPKLKVITEGKFIAAVKTSSTN